MKKKSAPKKKSATKQPMSFLSTILLSKLAQRRDSKHYTVWYLSSIDGFRCRICDETMTMDAPEIENHAVYHLKRVFGREPSDLEAKTLTELLESPGLQDLSPEEIGRMWQSQIASPGCVSGTSETS